MPLLRFDFEDEPRDDDPDMLCLWTLRDYILDEAGMSMQRAAQTILEAISATREDQSVEAANLAEDITRVSEHISPDDSSLGRLLDLTFVLYDSDKWVKSSNFDPWDILLRESAESNNSVGTSLVRSERSGPDDIGPDLRYRNLHAFNAHIDKRAGRNKVRPPSWVLNEMGHAHEGDLRLPYFRMCDAHALAAAQWIMTEGDKIYRFVLEGHRDLAHPNGPIWEAQSRELLKAGISQTEICKKRWLFWQKQFQALAEGDRDHEFPFHETTKKSATEVVEQMRWIGKAAAN